MSFRLKTILGIAFIEVLLLAILVASTHWHLAKTNADQLMTRARTEAKLLSTMVADAVIALDLATIDALLGHAVDNEGISYVRVRAPSGDVLSEAGDAVALRQTFRIDESVESARGDRRFDTVAPIMVGGSDFGRVEIGVPIAGYEAALARSLRWSLLVAGAEIGLVALLGYILGSVLTRQLAELRDGARRIGAGALGLQLPMRGRDELAQTVACFNIMSRRLARAQRALDDQHARLEKQVADRTEELALQAERLAQALEAEKSLNAMQRQFVSMVSHEFRTPLAIITGKARRIDRRAGKLTTEMIRDEMTVIDRQVARLIDLIESVLAAARLEEGKVKFCPKATDLAEMIAEARQSAADLFPDHSFELEVGDGVDDFVCDPTLMRQVISNLLSNAGKYSDPGGRVSIAAHIDQGGGNLRISVSDTGVGVPPEELDRMFARFFRASTAAGRPGSGIGLHMIKQFVELHDGRIELESEVGVGSTFHVVLPTSIAPASQAA